MQIGLAIGELPISAALVPTGRQANDVHPVWLEWITKSVQQVFSEDTVLNWPSKTPVEERSFGADWRPMLSKLGDPTIENSVWTRLSGDATVETGWIESDERQTGVLISGGTVDTVSTFRNTVTLSDAQVLTCDALVRVR